MQEFCRHATLDDLKGLVQSLNQQDVDYLLIGGYALFVHGYHRATTDIDVLVRALPGEPEKKPAFRRLFHNPAISRESPCYQSGINSTRRLRLLAGLSVSRSFSLERPTV